MKKIYFSLAVALALMGGASQSNAKAETLKSSKAIVCNYNYTIIIKIGEDLYLATYDDNGHIIDIVPYE